TPSSHIPPLKDLIADVFEMVTMTTCFSPHFIGTLVIGQISVGVLSRLPLRDKFPFRPLLALFAHPRTRQVFSVCVCSLDPWVSVDAALRQVPALVCVAGVIAVNHLCCNATMHFLIQFLLLGTDLRRVSS